MTVNRATLIALGREVVTLKGPSREVDRRIEAAIVPEGESSLLAWIARIWRPAPRYTDSIDACYALLIAKRPKWTIMMVSYFDGDEVYTAGVVAPSSSEERGYSRTGQTMQLAICAAVLRAVAGVSPND